MNKRSNSGKATAAAMTDEQLHERAMKGVQAKKEKASLPRVRYQGELKVGDAILDVAVLDNDMRIVKQSAVWTALGRPARGNARLINTPVFMDAKNLQDFINQDLRDVINKITYVDKQGKTQEGYNVLILPRVANLYLAARQAKALHPSQELTAQKAEILTRALTEVGITALVDEATGYQDARAKDALAKIFESFIAKELQPWIKTFPDDYYKELFRLYNLEYPPKNGKVARPQFFGKVTNKVIHNKLAPEILPELKKQASKYAKGTRLHQTLTTNKGHPDLIKLLASVTTIMKLSKTKEEFFKTVDEIHPDFSNNYTLDFED